MKEKQEILVSIMAFISCIAVENHCGCSYFSFIFKPINTPQPSPVLSQVFNQFLPMWQACNGVFCKSVYIFYICQYLNTSYCPFDIVRKLLSYLLVKFAYLNSLLKEHWYIIQESIFKWLFFPNLYKYKLVVRIVSTYNKL